MNLFKRNKVFNQFNPLIEGLEEIDKPLDFPKFAGILKVYKTNYSNLDIAKFATAYKLKVSIENEKAVSYKKVDGKHDVVWTFNKESKDLMIAVSRSRK